MEAMVQMNTRLPRSMKKAGDEALASIGLTPSQAVRAVWEKASNRGKDLEEIASLLAPSPTTDADGAPDDTLERGWALVSDGLKALGIPDDASSTPLPSDDELLDEFWNERMVERRLA